MNKLIIIAALFFLGACNSNPVPTNTETLIVAQMIWDKLLGYYPLIAGKDFIKDIQWRTTRYLDEYGAKVVGAFTFKSIICIWNGGKISDTALAHELIHNAQAQSGYAPINVVTEVYSTEVIADKINSELEKGGC